MSEKEQAQAVKLLAEWLRASNKADLQLDELEDIRDRTEKFLKLPLVEPESHGHRRS